MTSLKLGSDGRTVLTRLGRAIHTAHGVPSPDTAPHREEHLSIGVYTRGSIAWDPGAWPATVLTADRSSPCARARKTHRRVGREGICHDHI